MADPHNPRQWLPIKSEIEALKEAYQFWQKGQPVRAIAQWLEDKTGRAMHFTSLNEICQRLHFDLTIKANDNKEHKHECA